MSDLEGLVAAALVGVGRRPLPDRLRVGEHDVAGPAARALLDGAALHAAARRAGRRPALAAEGPPAAAAADRDLPAAPGPASQLLELLLTGSLVRGPSAAALIGYWIACAATAGRRVPHRHLVALLGERRPGPGGSADPDLTAVLGERGRWLAAMNPAWSWAVAAAGDPPPDPSAGRPTADRSAHRVPEHAPCHDPAGFRELVRSSWAGASAADREQHLRALAPSLGPGDEPLLTRALGDRSRQVRVVAAELLVELPDSVWARQRVERLRSLVRVDGRLRRRLVVDLPDGDDELGDPPHGVSRRSHQLEVLVSLAPLSLWTELTGWDAATLAERGAEQPEVVRGWIRAAVHRADPDWAAALLARYPHPSLVEVVGDARAVPFVEQALRGPSPPAFQLAFAMGAGTAPWSRRLSELVVQRLRADPNPATLAREHGADLGARLHPSAVGELQRWHDGLGSDQRYLALPVRSIIQHVSTRTAIAEAFELTPDDPTTREDNR